jgi:hypothetical protein
MTQGLNYTFKQKFNIKLLSVSPLSITEYCAQTQGWGVTDALYDRNKQGRKQVVM